MDRAALRPAHALRCIADRSPQADHAHVAVLLAAQGWLPWWFTLLVVGRDLVIVAGAAAYHFAIGEVEMAPS